MDSFYEIEPEIWAGFKSSAFVSFLNVLVAPDSKTELPDTPPQEANRDNNTLQINALSM